MSLPANATLCRDLPLARRGPPRYGSECGAGLASPTSNCAHLSISPGVWWADMGYWRNSKGYGRENSSADVHRHDARIRVMGPRLASRSPGYPKSGKRPDSESPILPRIVAALIRRFGAIVHMRRRCRVLAACAQSREHADARSPERPARACPRESRRGCPRRD